MARTESSGTDGGFDASSAASALSDASFVRVVARATGDAVAAAGLLGRALDARGTPFQVSVASTIAERSRRVADAAAADATVVVGTANDADAIAIDPGDEPASVAAWRLAREFDGRSDPVLALAGVVAAGELPGAGSSATVLEAAESNDRLSQRPGVAGPTDDVVDTLAHSTLLHASFSGSTGEARDALAKLGLGESDDAAGSFDDAERRRVASYAAVDATGHAEAPPVAGDGIERALRPYAIANDEHATASDENDAVKATASDEPAFATVAGYADVLDVVAETAAGTAVALALGHAVADSAIDAWRDRAEAAHAAVSECERSRHAGLTCVHDVGAHDGADDGGAQDGAHDDAPLGATARLVRDYRSPEPVVAAFGDDAVALAAAADAVDAGDVAPLGDPLARVTTRVGGEYDATATRGYATLATDTDSFVTELREALTDT